ncbi:uncharacterized protein B0H64DRAFT_49369 [Chaetomium fimeti]|uniref:Uncharacterized protein n=1 Tax=Chaetomium fimeti TaxID=1854472 RepID=A0AAE0LMS8_9PEZI|nr:hypothetical protein B0H64DRAFT_49369 [Chaetomium fimeti]
MWFVDFCQVVFLSFSFHFYFFSSFSVSPSPPPPLSSSTFSSSPPPSFSHFLLIMPAPDEHPLVLFPSSHLKKRQARGLTLVVSRTACVPSWPPSPTGFVHPFTAAHRKPV